MCVEIPKTWDLYQEPGVRAANRALAVQVTASVERLLGATPPADTKRIISELRERIEPVFDKYVDLGANDSEPLFLLARVLSMVATETGADRDAVYMAARYRQTEEEIRAMVEWDGSFREFVADRLGPALPPGREPRDARARATGKKRGARLGR